MDSRTFAAGYGCTHNKLILLLLLFLLHDRPVPQSPQDDVLKDSPKKCLVIVSAHSSLIVPERGRRKNKISGAAERERNVP